MLKNFARVANYKQNFKKLLRVQKSGLKFSAVLSSKRSKWSDFYISSFLSKFKPTFQNLIFYSNTDKMAAMKQEENC